ncbi:GNAT family N-acetyltransferase [Staphylococcus simulans]|uniref:GNAT family N-acetyltransferase n=1 Tax=Staphylococcus simulans TaxID=1286 RepID=UPI000D032913|nr:GNAT family protein [Staphylococcus simulans]
MMLYLPIDNDLKLVQPEIQMAQSLFNVIEQERAFLSTYLPFIDHTLSVQDEIEFIKLMLTHQSRGTGRLFLIYYQDQLVGTIDLHQVNQEHQKAWVGYWLSSQYNGRGIMTRCLTALCDFAFNSLNLNKLSIHANIKNEPSINVAKRAGFQYVGSDKEELYERGQYEDFVRYALLKREFNSQNSL